MTTLYWDIETRSVADLRKVGVYKYAAHPTTDVILAAWAIDDEPVRWTEIGDNCGTSDLAGDLFLADRVVAHNAGFERTLLNRVLVPKYGFDRLPLERWDCTAARAARQALPRSLDGAARALGLDVTKDKDGHSLMMRMCRPRRIEVGRLDAAKENLNKDHHATQRIVWWDEPEKIERLGQYCATDVEVERQLDKILAPMNGEQSIWMLTEKMNDRGVQVDVAFANDARWVASEALIDLDYEMREVTGGVVPAASSVPRLRKFVEQQGYAVDSLDKAAIEELLKGELKNSVRRALEIRQEAGKTSVAKYQAIIDRADADGRVRGNLVYHAASTGRWAGAGVQMQNMKRATRPDWEAVRDCLAEFGDPREVREHYGPPMTVLSEMIRGTVVAPEGKELWWADYNAIEARGVAWLAGADTLVDLFASGGKIYEHMAAQIYRVELPAVTTDQRWVGKQTVLGCGYGMGATKFLAQCDKYKVTVPLAIADAAVSTFRTANPEIPALWRGMENAAKAATTTPDEVFSCGGVKFKRIGNWLLMRLPSGRSIYYCRPRVVMEETKFGQRAVLEYDASNPMTKQWGAERTWGGKLTENAVQGLCRDIMRHAKEKLDEYGYCPILSVHDEIICEQPLTTNLSLDGMIEVMTYDMPEWAKGFPITAEGKKGTRYGK